MSVTAQKEIDRPVAETAHAVEEDNGVWRLRHDSLYRLERFRIHFAITVVGRHPATIGTGPLGGHTVDTGIVIASTDALAAEVVGARLLVFTPQAVRHLWKRRD